MTNQNDFVIDNGTGLAVRTDIQDALQALAGNSSGNSEPSVKYAYQWWADSNAAVMKLRNSANDGWIELFQLDGTLTLEDGSVSAPALAFRDDLNTGIYSSAADTFNVATAGVERMELGATTIFNEAGADVDFRIEGDTDTNLFYVDAGNNRVGIGLSSPTALLDVDGITKTTQLAIGASASIVASTLMQVNVSHSLSSSSTYPFILNNETTTAANAKGILIKWTGSSGNFSADTGGDYLRCTANGEGFVNAVITGAGLGQFRGGVRFGTDSADANTLHDYEEGTFTMHFNVEGESNLSMAGRVGEYVKIGRTVHIIGGGTCGSVSGATTSKAIDFTNLPFAMVNTGIGTAGHPFPVNFLDLDSTGLDEMVGNQPYVFRGRLNNNATNGRIVAYKADGNQNPQNASKAITSNSQIYCMFTYVTAA